MQRQKQRKYQINIGADIHYIQASANYIRYHQGEFLLANRRQMYMLKTQTRHLLTYKLQQERILHATYSKPIEVDVLLTDHGLLFVNKQCETIGHQKLAQLAEAKIIYLLNVENSCKQLNTLQDLLIFFTDENIFSLRIKINYEFSYLKAQKTISACKITTMQKPILITDTPEWVEKTKLLAQRNLLICWSSAETYIYKIPQKIKHNIKVQHIYTKISRRDNKVTDFQLSWKHRYLIAAYQLGSIKIYKYDETNKYIQQLRGHQRQCTSVMVSQKNDNLLYSAGLDNTIRIWNLATYHEIYLLRLDIICNFIILNSDCFAFVKEVGSRRIGVCDMNTFLLDPIITQSVGSKLVSVECYQNWGIALYSTNHIQFFPLYAEQDQIPSLVQRIQFPIQYGQLRCSYKLNNQTFAVAIEKGFSLLKLCQQQMTIENFQLKKLVYNQSIQLTQGGQSQKKLMQILHQRLLGTFLFSVIQDWRGIPSALTITQVSFIFNTVLPKWDIDLKAKVENSQPSNYVILGTDKGFVYFVDIKAREKYYTRVHFHSNSVIKMKRIMIPNEKNKLLFLSITIDDQLSIWQILPDQPPRQFYRFYMTNPISCLQVYENFIVFGEKTGKLNIILAQYEDNNLCFYMDQKNSIDGHLRSIICIDHYYLNNRHFFVTGDEESIIKIWLGVQKILVFQLRLFGELSTVCFMKKQLDLLISSSGQVSFLKTKKCKQLKEAYYISSKQNQIDKSEVSLKDLFAPYQFNRNTSNDSIKKQQRAASPKSPRRKIISPLSPRKSKNSSPSAKKIVLPAIDFSGRDKRKMNQNVRKKKMNSFRMQGVEAQSVNLPLLPKRFKWNHSEILPPQPTKHRYEETSFDLLTQINSSRGNSYSSVGKKKI